MKFLKKKYQFNCRLFFKKKIDYFNKKNNIKEKKFSLITSFAMFYDIDDPNSFAKILKTYLLTTVYGL